MSVPTLSQETTIAPTAWDLDSIFSGGPDGEAFTAGLKDLHDGIADHKLRVAALGPVADGLDAWSDAIREKTALMDRLGSLWAYASCRASANTDEPAAAHAREQVLRALSELNQIAVDVKAGLDEADDESFASLVSRSDLADEADMLRNDRRRRALRLPRREQALLTALTPHALGGWGSVYTELSGSLKATVRLPGEEPSTRSAGQVNGLLGSSDPEVRAAAHAGLTEAWNSVAPTCARALEHITGARAALNAHRGVDELADTCARNRIDRSTLEALWAASDHARPLLQTYLARRAQLAGVEKLALWDTHAPMAQAGAPSDKVAWSDACRWILEAFNAFDPEMAAFAARAIESRWIEAEDRPNKRTGGFCSRVADRGESRIFLTWSGTMRSVVTLAHELGHAWHNEMLFRQPPARREITSATAETASTFAEALVRDYLMTQTNDPHLRLAMLDEQGLAGVGLLLNIRARYVFERELYRMQARGPLTPDALGEAMVLAQKEAFGPDTLGGWDPTFWASKLHFYIARFGFYNWPYTFGYLFSTAVYDRARTEGRAYAPTVHRLLSETGFLWTEEVGHRFLDADLGDPDFWIGATRPLTDALEAFLAETEPAP